MRKMSLEDITIKETYAASIPGKDKIEECRNYWSKYHCQDRYIVIDTNNILIDGYIQYLILKENNVKEAEVKISNHKKKQWQRKRNDIKKKLEHRKTTTYIYGIHPGEKVSKERVWRVSHSWTGWENDLLPGDIITVRSERGIVPVIITKIKWSNQPPIDIPIKKVVSKYYI